MYVRVNLDYSGGGAMSWNQWLSVLDARVDRCVHFRLPSSVYRPIWTAIADMIETVLFSGRISPKAQYTYYKQETKGMYGAGKAKFQRSKVTPFQAPKKPKSAAERVGGGMGEMGDEEDPEGPDEVSAQAPSGRRRGGYGRGRIAQGDAIINPWERMGGDAVKALVANDVRAMKGTENEHLYADVLESKGPGFLESMRQLGPQTDWGGDLFFIEVHTLATMTPYDPTAGGTMPIMHYLKYGWTGDRAMMRARWPQGVVPYVYRYKPYARFASLIPQYIMRGHAGGH